MSLARAFTKRDKHAPTSNQSADSSPFRPFSSNRNAKIDRAQISSPIALLSTTNMLSYTAPDVAVMRERQRLSPWTSSSSSVKSHSSAEDSDRTYGSKSSQETDASSVDSPPTSPETDNLPNYFHRTKFTMTGRSESSSQVRDGQETPESVPTIPQRAPSHSKRAHELAHTRSLRSSASSNKAHSTSHSASQRSSHDHGSTHTASSSLSTREQRPSADIARSNVEPNHPFGAELEQLNEVVEDLGGAIHDAETGEDSMLMVQKGLIKFCAAEYMAEIEPCYAALFDAPISRLLRVDAAWI